jgi:RimJ/RimL family protein N-acetyltransferase
MSEEPIRLRPIEEADLATLRRFDTDPSSRGPFLPSGFRSPRARQRRWEEDGWLGDDSAQLAVVLPDDTLAGIVSWGSIKTGGPDLGCLEIGILLFPSTAARALGPRRNDSWSSTCLRPRWPTESRPSPMLRTSPSRKRWSVSGSAARA